MCGSGTVSYTHLDVYKRQDIGILDISMEELGGITLGRKLKEKNHDIKIIYITSYEEYMAQAINKVHAFSFLCKPINEEEMKTPVSYTHLGSLW